MLDRLTEAAPAKINLYLHVTGRRDGYHLLDSLVVFAGIGDTLTAELADTLSLEVRGPFVADLANQPDNLVLRAARSLAAVSGATSGAALTLTKRLPVASGIGGGSADAAATLRLLCRLWQLAADQRTLTRLAEQLGADVPVCLLNKPARMQGIGEQLEAAPSVPRCGILLVNPSVALPTAEVFRAREGAFSPTAVLPLSWPTACAMADQLGDLRNDLEPPAMRLRPIIGTVLAALQATRGCLLARMSGSGATCFALYPDHRTAELAAGTLPERDWWRWAGPLSCA